MAVVVTPMTAIVADLTAGPTIQLKQETDMYLEMKIMVKTSIKAKEDQTDKTIKTCKGIQIMDIQQPGKVVIWIDTIIQIVHLF